MNNKKYSSKRRVLLELNSLKDYHLNNTVDKKIDKKKEYKKLFNIYNKLDYKYTIFELYIRQLESKSQKDYLDFLVLGGYKEILKCKKFMYNKQLEIHKLLNDLEHMKYVIHNDNNSKIGIPVIDYSKIYFRNCNVNMNWEECLKSILKDNFGQIYYDLFLFKTCYIILINCKLSNSMKYNFEQMNQLSNNLKRFLSKFNVS